MRWGVVAAFVFCCGFCAADEIELDAVRETLDVAIDQYFKDVINVDKKITESIDRRIKMKGNLGDLDGVLSLQKQRAIYLTEGVLPKDNVYRATRQQAEFGINRAKSRLDTAYEEVIEGLTKEGRYTDAKRIKDERLRLEQKLAVPESELRPTKIINRARERNNPPNEQPKKDALAAGMNKEEIEIDQPVPEILNEIDGWLSDEQQNFVRNLPSLTDEIAKSLSRTSGHLYFDSLKKISGHDAEILLDGPSKSFFFFNATELTEDFLTKIENYKKDVGLYIMNTPITVGHFERLMNNENIAFEYRLHLYTDAHIEKLIELGKEPRSELHAGQHLQEDVDMALKIQPHGCIAYKLWSSDNSKLQANMVKGIEKLASLLALINFKEIDLDILPILETRSKNGFPTLVINSVIPNEEFQERIKSCDVHVLKINIPKKLDESMRRIENEWLDLKNNPN